MNSVNINIDEEHEEHEEHEEDKEHPIAILIDNFVHHVFDIENAAKEFIALAEDKYRSNAEFLKQEFEEAHTLVDSDKEQEQIIGIRKLRKAINNVKSHNLVKLPEVLEKSLFIYIFSAFDNFIGDLIKILFEKKPILFKKIKREICLSDALQYNSLDELREVVLEKEIETLKRKSYIDQFKELEKLFDVSTLTAFTEWANFIESSQRRNLFTHCDGKVSEQYLDICSSVGFQKKNLPTLGEKLELGPAYFLKATIRILNIAVMLGQTLWRKVLPHELNDADLHLQSLIFSLLEREDWFKAILLSKFAIKLPKISNDQIDRINHVNYAIALKAIENHSEVKRILNKKDWSATNYDFQLAYNVLMDDYSKAGEIMEKIGKKGELVTELGYHEWPLFRNFRDSTEFMRAYRNIYGYEYIQKLSLLADEAQTEIEN